MQSDGPAEPAGDKVDPKEAVASSLSVEIETNSVQDVSYSSASTPTSKGMFLELVLVQLCYHVFMSRASQLCQLIISRTVFILSQRFAICH